MKKMHIETKQKIWKILFSIFEWKHFFSKNEIKKKYKIDLRTLDKIRWIVYSRYVSNPDWKPRQKLYMYETFKTFLSQPLSKFLHHCEIVDILLKYSDSLHHKSKKW